MPLLIKKNQRAEKEKNLQATAVSDEDFTTSVKSGIDALGSGNPMTIQTSGALPGTITVQGGQYIMIQYPCYIHRGLYHLRSEVGWVVFQWKNKQLSETNHNLHFGTLISVRLLLEFHIFVLNFSLFRKLL